MWIHLEHGSVRLWRIQKFHTLLSWVFILIGKLLCRKILVSLALPLTCIPNYYIIKTQSKIIINYNEYIIWKCERYDPGFKTASQLLIREKVLPYANDPYLVGWYLDNEIHLGTNWWRSVTLFAEYINFTTTSYAWKATQTYVKKLYPTVTALNTAW